VIVQRRVDFVQHADRRRVGEEHREDQRQRGQRLLAAREQRERLRLLAGRLGDDFETRFQRIVALDQGQFGLPPPNSSVNSRLKWPLTVSNECQQALARFLVQALDALYAAS
jgi:hypothetical protein